MRNAEEHILKNGKTVVIRELKPDEDVFELSRFVNEMMESKYWSRPKETTPEEQTKWVQEELEKIRKKAAVCLVAEKNGGIVGQATVESHKHPLRKHTAEFGIIIRPSWQGIGVGYLLTEKVLKKAKKNKKFKIIFLKVFSNNKKAVKMYKQFGFRQVARLPCFYRRGNETCDELYMVLKK